MITKEGIREVYFGFTGRMKAGDQNCRGAVPRSMGQKRVAVNNFDRNMTEALEDIVEIERRIKSLQYDVVRIGNVIRRRRREVTE